MIFASCLPIYECDMKTMGIHRFVKNSCYYEGKAYTLGSVIETAPGIKCECAFVAADTFPTWASGNWS